MTFPRTALLLAGAAAAALSAAAAQEVGINSAIRNDVRIQTGDGPATAAEVGGDVRLNDTVTSGEDSALQILLLDETVFTVGPQAELVIDRFVYDPDGGDNAMTATVKKGAFRFMSGRTAKTSDDVQVNTPVASMGIRGTIVEGAVGREAIDKMLGREGQFSDIAFGDETTLIVLRGPGEDAGGIDREGAIDIRFNNGNTVTLDKPNAAILMPTPQAPPVGPFTLPESAVGSFGSTLVSRPNGPPSNPVPNVPLPSNVVPPPTPPDFTENETPQNTEEDQVEDPPVSSCIAGIIADAVPVTDGGLILDGQPGVLFDDFGTPDFGAECLE